MAPHPRMKRREINEGRPFYQLDTAGFLRMEARIPGLQVAQHPEVLKPSDSEIVSTAKPAELSGTWQEAQWKRDPRLQRPVGIVLVMGERKHVELGDVLKFFLRLDMRYAFFYGREVHRSRGKMAGVKRDIIMRPIEECDTPSLIIEAKNGRPNITDDTVLFLEETDILEAYPALEFGIALYGVHSTVRLRRFSHTPIPTAVLRPTRDWRYCTSLSTSGMMGSRR
ncbi:hypothetical protein K470DRAFT_12776 [Piedraia hortae CBS 480.64]|uniref:Uncharacterized protein n=1 Tax=Piedraia hortae CBS 480.64 TaxID=1314780 RepID=A0A6A7BPN7_9PEZI|nr:hypothetical protein K470DRAFT_12776 [Piedraia hortae CBS 480.64]